MSFERSQRTAPPLIVLGGLLITDPPGVVAVEMGVLARTTRADSGDVSVRDTQTYPQEIRSTQRWGEFCPPAPSSRQTAARVSSP